MLHLQQGNKTSQGKPTLLPYLSIGPCEQGQGDRLRPLQHHCYSHHCHLGALINYRSSGLHHLHPLPEPSSNPYRAKLQGSKKLLCKGAGGLAHSALGGGDAPTAAESLAARPSALRPRHFPLQPRPSSLLPRPSACVPGGARPARERRAWSGFLCAPRGYCGAQSASRLFAFTHPTASDPAQPISSERRPDSCGALGLQGGSRALVSRVGRALLWAFPASPRSAEVRPGPCPEYRVRSPTRSGQGARVGGQGRPSQ